MLGNAIVEIGNAPGTGGIPLIGAATGRVRFRSQFASGAKVFYCIADGTQIECGVGTLTHGSPDTLSRDQVLWNSAGTAPNKLNFAGEVKVYCEVPASRLPYVLESGGLSVDATALSRPLYGGASTGSATSLNVACTPAVPALVDGMRIHFRVHAAAAPNATLRVNGLTAKPIMVVRAGSLTAAWTGDWAAGRWLDVFFDASQDCFVLENPADADWAPGDVRVSYRTAHAGWVRMNDGTIGKSGSGATTRANDDTRRVYELLWNAVADTWAPVAGGRGASATADFDAGKVMTLPRVLGRALAAYGGGSGLTNRVIGSWLGAETHTLTIAEMPTHSHTASTGSAGGHIHTGATNNAGAHAHNVSDIMISGSSGLGSNTPVPAGVGTRATDVQGTHAHSVTTDPAGDHTHTVTVQNQGGGNAHNNMQPTTFLSVWIKL